jgi:hypothetical protein
MTRSEQIAWLLVMIFSAFLWVGGAALRDEHSQRRELERQIQLNYEEQTTPCMSAARLTR